MDAERGATLSCVPNTSRKKKKNKTKASEAFVQLIILQPSPLLRLQKKKNYKAPDDFFSLYVFVVF